MPECCAPCPAVSTAAGIKSGHEDAGSIDGKRELRCKCRTCCCGKPPIVKPCYKQPRIPDSYAPKRCYIKPSAPMESGTTYKMSFLPVEGCRNLRGEARRPTANLVPSTELMEGGTVQKLSYLPNPVCMQPSIRPCHHDMWGRGPMQNITTQRHDYVPKASVPRESFKPAHQYHSVEQPFENRTVNRMSFLDPGRCPKPESYAPLKCYDKPSAKMECTTTQKMSYQPVCMSQRQRPPWANKAGYQKPNQKLEGTTVYRQSFLPPGEDCTEYVDPCKYGDCKPCDCVCPSECIETDPCACNYPKAACCA